MNSTELNKFISRTQQHQTRSHIEVDSLHIRQNARISDSTLLLRLYQIRFQRTECTNTKHYTGSADLTSVNSSLVTVQWCGLKTCPRCTEEEGHVFHIFNPLKIMKASAFHSHSTCGLGIFIWATLYLTSYY